MTWKTVRARIVTTGARKRQLIDAVAHTFYIACIFLVNMAFLLYCLHATKKRALEGKTAYKSRVLAKEFAQKSNIL